MKSKSRNNRALVCMLPAMLVALVFSGEVVSQDNDKRDLVSFSIVVNTKSDQIKLYCKDGCAWSELSFAESIVGGPQAVSHSGLTTLDGDGAEQASESEAFVFTVARTDSGISLQGIRGTAWTHLAFSCPRRGCNQAIDEYGMVSARMR